MSLAPAYFISQSAIMPLLLLSKSNPLRWASIWLFLSLDISVLYRHSYQKNGDPLGVAVFLPGVTRLEAG